MSCVGHTILTYAHIKRSARRVVTYAYERTFGKGAHFTVAVGPIMTAVVIFFVLLVGGLIFQVSINAQE